MANRKAHFVPKKQMRRENPLPTACENQRATIVTCDITGVTCRDCLKVLGLHKAKIVELRP